MTSVSLPTPPTFDDALVEKCRAGRDFRPMLFDWYKYVATLSLTVGSILPDSPGVRRIPSIHFGTLVGLLNRCFRLMMSNVALIADGHFVEATQVLDRCVIESALKIQWLCLPESKARFSRFLADGLSRDLKLKDHIQQSMRERGGRPLVIERRMVESIQGCLGAAGLSEGQVRGAARLPTLDLICVDLKLPEGFYIAVQGMGSHPVHGTWTDLIRNYLIERDGVFKLRYEGVTTHHNQYVIVSRMVVRSIRTFLSHITDPEDVKGYHEAAAMADREIASLDQADQGNDFEIAPGEE